MKFLLCFLLLCLSFTAFAQEDSFLVLSDIHLNINMTDEEGNFYHKDISKNLLASVINNIGGTNYSFLIVPGDLYYHDPQKNETARKDSCMDSTYRYLSNELKKIKAKKIFALGNNDCANHDDPKTTDYNRFLDNFFPDADSIINHDFKQLGCYMYNTGNLCIISLNTVNFDNKEKAEQVLTWLDTTLKKIKKKKNIWLVYHIPPGSDRYFSNAIRLGNHDDHPNSWNKSVQKSFIDIINSHKEKKIKFQLAGHTHMNDYRFISDADNAIIHIAPGLDSRNGNNPAYQVIHYDSKEDTIKSITTYYLDFEAKGLWSSFVNTNFKFLTKNENCSPEKGREFVNEYFVKRKMETICNDTAKVKWGPDFRRESFIKN